MMRQSKQSQGCVSSCLLCCCCKLIPQCTISRQVQHGADTHPRPHQAGLRVRVQLPECNWSSVAACIWPAAYCRTAYCTARLGRLPCQTMSDPYNEPCTCCMGCQSPGAEPPAAAAHVTRSLQNGSLGQGMLKSSAPA